MIEIIHGSSDDKPRGNGTSNEVCPEGTYVATIARALPRESEYSVGDGNPKGLEITLWLDIDHNGARYRVFDSIPMHKVYRLNEVLGALALPAINQQRAEFDETQLEDAEIGVRVWHTKAGKAKAGEYVNPASVRGTSKRTAAAPRVTRKAVSDSDIPF